MDSSALPPLPPNNLAMQPTQLPPHNPPSRSSWWVKSLAVIGGFTLAGAALVGLTAGFFLIWFIWSVWSKQQIEESVLWISLSEPVLENEAYNNSLDGWLHPALTHRQLIFALQRALSDPKIRGVFLEVGSPQMSLAQLQEIREYLKAFREAGKPVVAFSESLGEFGGGTLALYMASVANHVVVQPSGDVSFTGLAIESMFIKGTLDKLGLEARFEGRHEFKNAVNMFTETGLTDAHRENLQGILDDLFAQMIEGIAEGRQLTFEKVRSLAAHGPWSAKEGLELGLIDQLGYQDDARQWLRENVGEGVKVLDVDSYAELMSNKWNIHREPPKLALVHVAGTIVGGESKEGIFESTVGAATLVGALMEAADDEDVRAVVLRIDSPGGSYVASDTIWRAVEQVKESGKPVVVSMGGIAASGGYFVAAPADWIVAMPGTLTGSIGVYAGKILTRQFWERLGVTFDGVATDESAWMFSDLHDFSPAQQEKFRAFLDRAYGDFLSRVKGGRRLDDDGADRAARGRVWTGRQALALGLVDEIGGLHQACLSALKLAELEGDDYVLEVFPKSPPFWESLFQQSQDEVALRVMQHWVKENRRVADLFQLLAQEGRFSRQERVLFFPFSLRLP